MSSGLVAGQDRMSTSQNKDTVERYLEGFRRLDHTQILGCLTDAHGGGGRHVMAEMVGSVPRDDGSVQRMSMAEVFVMRDGLICERRAWVIVLTEDDVR